uniref:Structure-specific endonuclease subunit SLX4 n=1 Tax=Romanomermis culicivorax TaxID=13658 RepID=A0A915LBI2_ROMCU
MISLDQDEKITKCQVCEKDLSHLNDIRRLQHLNRCLDSKEQHTKFENKVVAYNNTIDCPICQIPLPPGPFRISHLKKCSNQNNIAIREVLQLLQTQESIASARKAKNLPHTKASVPSLERCAPKKSKSKLQPSSLDDEQIQLAKSLSLSESRSTVLPESQSCSISLDSFLGLKTASEKITKLESSSDEARLETLQERLLGIVSNSVNKTRSSVVSQAHSNDRALWWNMHKEPPSKNSKAIFEQPANPLENMESDDVIIIDDIDTPCCSGSVSNFLTTNTAHQISRSVTPDLFENPCETNQNCSFTAIIDCSPFIEHADPDSQSSKEAKYDFIQYERLENTKRIIHDNSISEYKLGIESDDEDLDRPLHERIKLKLSGSNGKSTTEDRNSKTVTEIDSKKKLLSDTFLEDAINMLANDSSFFDGSVAHQDCSEKALTEEKTSLKSQHASEPPKNLFTPTQTTFKIVKRTNVTPMPDYHRFTSPELSKELEKYGLKNMAKRRALPLLKRLFDETHPYVDEDGRLFVKMTDNLTEKEKTKKDKKKSNRRISSSQPVMKSTASKRNKNCEQNESLSQTDKLSKSFSDDEDDCISEQDILEESFFPEVEKDVTMQEEVDVDQKLRDFFRSDTSMYTKILTYEPIPLKETHLSVKSIGIKCSLNYFMDFLDKQGITFTMKDDNANKPRRHY